MRSDKERVLDIQEAITSIQGRVDVKQQFDDDDMLRVWCLHHLIIIGEAAARISTSLRENHPSVPWKRIVAMRNAVVHGYFQVDWQEVWSVVEKDIPQLKVDIDTIIRNEGWG